MPRKQKKPTRRGNKEGSIYQRKDGKWCGQVLVGYNELGKPVRKTFYGDTREKVAEKVSEGTHQVFSGKLTKATAERMTVRDFVNGYLWTFKKPTVSDVTFEWYLNAANTHIIPALGDIKAVDLTTYAIQALLNDMDGRQKLSKKTLKAVRDLINQTFTHAVALKRLHHNPVTETKLPKQARVKAEQKETIKAIPVAERTKVLFACKDNLCMRTALTVLMFTGMRIGEFLALPWGNIDFRNNVITINQAQTHVCEYGDDGKLKSRTKVIGNTKTQCSTRKIKAPPAVMNVLAEWRAHLPEHVRVRVTHDLLADDAPVFPNDMGQMRSYNGFRTTYRRFMAENGLVCYPLHCYRHTHATMLLEQGVNPKVVQKLLGHRDIETTLGIYSHVLPEVFDTATDTIEAIYTWLQKDASIHCAAAD